MNHVLYKDGDADVPDGIREDFGDGVYGSVSLGVCRNCGKGEADLEDCPVCPGKPDVLGVCPNCNGRGFCDGFDGDLLDCSCCGGRGVISKSAVLNWVQVIQEQAGDLMYADAIRTELRDVLKQWATAERDGDETELANARASRDSLLKRM